MKNNWKTEKRSVFISKNHEEGATSVTASGRWKYQPWQTDVHVVASRKKHAGRKKFAVKARDKEFLALGIFTVLNTGEKSFPDIKHRSLNLFSPVFIRGIFHRIANTDWKD